MSRRVLALLAGAFLLALFGWNLLSTRGDRHGPPPASGVDVEGVTAAYRPPDPARPDLACVFVFEDAAEAERFVKSLGIPGP